MVIQWEAVEKRHGHSYNEKLVIEFVRRIGHVRNTERNHSFCAELTVIAVYFIIYPQRSGGLCCRVSNTLQLSGNDVVAEGHAFDLAFGF